MLVHDIADATVAIGVSLLFGFGMTHDGAGCGDWREKKNQSQSSLELSSSVRVCGLSVLVRLRVCVRFISFFPCPLFRKSVYGSSIVPLRFEFSVKLISFRERQSVLGFFIYGNLEVN